MRLRGELFFQMRLTGILSLVFHIHQHSASPSLLQDVFALHLVVYVI